MMNTMITEEKLREVVNESEKRLSTKINDLGNEVANGFGIVSNCFTRLEGKTSELGREVASLSGQVKELSGEVKGLSREVGELVGDTRTLGETVYRKIDDLAGTVNTINDNVGMLKESLDLKSQVGNEGFKLNYDKNKSGYKELKEGLDRHHDRITTLERITGSI